MCRVSAVRADLVRNRNDVQLRIREDFARLAPPSPQDSPVPSGSPLHRLFIFSSLSLSFSLSLSLSLCLSLSPSPFLSLLIFISLSLSRTCWVAFPSYRGHDLVGVLVEGGKRKISFGIVMMSNYGSEKISRDWHLQVLKTHRSNLGPLAATEGLWRLPNRRLEMIIRGIDLHLDFTQAIESIEANRKARQGG